MALPDGAHQSEEEFSYFSLVHKAREGKDVEPTSVFGISCIRQMAASELIYRPEDVKRSAVQKAVVAVTDKPQSFSVLREKLSAVTRAWFAQKDFRDLEILQVGQWSPASGQRFQESLIKDTANAEDEKYQYFGLSLREVVHTFKWQSLVLLKALLLQPKVSTVSFLTSELEADLSRCYSSGHTASEYAKYNSHYYHLFLVSCAAYRTAPIHK